MPAQNTPAQKAKDIRLNIRLSPQEWDKIHRLAANTTCRSVSEYARKVLAKQPVTVFYRNQSFDEFEEQMIRLLNQLETFGDNYDQLVKKMATLEFRPEITLTIFQLHACMNDFSKTVTTIREHIEKLSDQCDPK